MNAPLTLPDVCGVSGRLGRSHVDRAAELRAFGNDDLGRLDVAVDGGRHDQLEPVICGDVACNLPLDGDIARVNGRFDARLGSDLKIALEVDLSADGSFD